MTIRTFKQFGLAYGSSPVTITAKINDVIVYQGPVATIDEPTPNLPDLNYSATNELFSWTVPDVSFTGNQVLDITTSTDGDSVLILQVISGNYSPMPADPPTDPQTYVSSGPDGYIVLSWSQFGNTYINGVLETVNHTADTSGQWWWSLPPNATFIENVNILPGVA